jgi:hypothetical protein
MKCKAYYNNIMAMIKKCNVDISACIHIRRIKTDSAVYDLVCIKMLRYVSNVSTLLVCHHAEN